MARITLSNGLTPKQDGFARSVVKDGLSLSAAYRANYDAEGMSSGAIDTEGHRLRRSPRVTRRIEELQDRIAAFADIDVLSIAAELEDARQVARRAKVPQASAMVAATIRKANLAGLLLPSVQIRKRVSVRVEQMQDDSTADLLALVDGDSRELAPGEEAVDGRELAPGAE